MKFGSKKKYLDWLAYGHATGAFAATPGHQKITIGGKPHRVCHNK